MKKQEMLETVDQYIEVGTIKVEKDGDDYKVYLLDEEIDYIEELSYTTHNIIENESWVDNSTDLTVYFNKKDDYYVLGVYQENGMCILEKKYHQWHSPEELSDFIFFNIADPKNSNVDCAFVD